MIRYLIVVLLASVFATACGPASPGDATSRTTVPVPLTSAVAEHPVTRLPTAAATLVLPTEEAQHTPTSTATPSVLTLLQHSFGQQGTDLWYALTVENPRADVAYTLIRYHVFFRGADGTVLKQAAGRIDYIHPQQKLGLMSYYPENDIGQVTALDIQFFPEDKTEMVPVAGTFVATDVAMVSDDQSTTAHALITSTFDQPVTNVPVVAIAYDDHNTIVGGGFEYIDSVAGTGSVAVDIPLFVKGKPARVEVYPSVDTASTIDGEVLVEMG